MAADPAVVPDADLLGEAVRAVFDELRTGHPAGSVLASPHLA
jgi:hypothetical protein